MEVHAKWLTGGDGTEDFVMLAAVTLKLIPRSPVIIAAKCFIIKRFKN